MKADATILKEIYEQRPSAPIGLLSRDEKDRLIERGVVGLYRWYLARSQATRNWNPDKSFNWRAFRTDHSPELNYILEGFYAVEQYVPDYVSKMLYGFVRKSHGRSQFQIRWGSEEQKHTDGWLNTLLFSRFRSFQWIEDYKQIMRDAPEWYLPWDDAHHMLFYTVIQERATQINYLNMAAIAGGKSDKPELANEVDPVLEQVCLTIATDEAAHYNFFLEVARLMFYYYPAQSLEALMDVIKHFAMPAGDIIPNFKRFEEAVANAGIFYPRVYVHDILQPVLRNLSVHDRKAFTYGVRRSRMVPDPDGNMRDTSLFDTINYGALQQAVKRLYGRIEKHEQEVGFADIDATCFVPSGLDADSLSN